MPFDSYLFVLLFLPLLVLVWKAVAIVRRERLALVLLVFSLVFLAAACPAALLLFAILVPVNYAFGLALASPGEREGSLRRRGLLLLALLVDFAPLVLARIAPVAGQALLGSPLQDILPVLAARPAADGAFVLQTAAFAGLSFWVLVQAAWLLSVYRRHVEPEGILRHAVFSLAFPYLLAGPVVRYEQMGPQLDRLDAPSAAVVARGLGLFVTGLAKKILLADVLASQADAAFSAVAGGMPIPPGQAWAGVLAFSFQLYFDFSAYCDMAMGAALMIGLRLPENFRSPYRAAGFIDFWRRWHVTLSSWLRDCVYAPCAGEWPGRGRIVLAFGAALLAAGLWHGAAATFVVWAAVHGVLLAANLGVRSLRSPVLGSLRASLPARIVGVALTFGMVTLAWVVFRSDTLGHALDMYRCLLGLAAPDAALQASPAALLPLAASFLVVFALPAAHDVFLGRGDGSRPWLRFSFSTPWAAILAALALLCLAVMDAARPFIF